MVSLYGSSSRRTMFPLPYQGPSVVHKQPCWLALSGPDNDFSFLAGFLDLIVLVHENNVLSGRRLPHGTGLGNHPWMVPNSNDGLRLAVTIHDLEADSLKECVYHRVQEFAGSSCMFEMRELFSGQISLVMNRKTIGGTQNVITPYPAIICIILSA